MTLGAYLYAPASSPEALYDAVLDVRAFPLWTPGVRGVDVLAGPVGGQGMVSEWEVAMLGVRRRVRSTLVEADRRNLLLRWTYDSGPVLGWGECRGSTAAGDGALAEFRTALAPAEPLLGRLATTRAARSAATVHLKGALVGLGRLVCGEDAPVRVGPPRTS